MARSKVNRRCKVIVTYDNGNTFEHPCWNSTVAMDVESRYMNVVNVMCTKTETISDEEYNRIIGKAKVSN